MQNLVEAADVRAYAQRGNVYILSRAQPPPQTQQRLVIM